MSDRWNLGYKNKMLSYKQFVAMTTLFAETSEQIFGTKCKLELTTMSAAKQYTTFMDDLIQEGLDATNKRNTLLKTDKLEEVTQEEWEKSRYVEVRVLPIDENAAPQYACGHLSFRGHAPNVATFYAQGGDTKLLKEALIAANKDMIVGDGKNCNGQQSLFVPSFGSSTSSLKLSSQLSAKLYMDETQRAEKAAGMYRGNIFTRAVRYVFG